MRDSNRSFALGLFALAACACSRPDKAGDPPAPRVTLPSAAEIVRVVRGSASLPRAALVAEGNRFNASTSGPFRLSGQLRASFGDRAAAPTHIASGDSSLDIEALDVADSPATMNEGVLVYRDVTPGVHAVVSADATRVEELRLLTRPVAEFSARYRLTLGPTLAKVRIVGASVEILDGSGAVLLRTAPISAVDADGVERLLEVAVSQASQQAIISVRLDTRGLKFPVVVDPSWSTGVTNPRGAAGVSTNYTAIARISGNSFLVVGGGTTAMDTTSRADRYDADTDAWATRASMSEKRGAYAMAATLAGAKVLVAGGASDSSTESAYLSSAEVFDSAANTWTTVGSMSVPRSNALAVTLTSGRVLVAGGRTLSYRYDSELYDPVAKTWSSVGAIPAPSGTFTVSLDGGGTLVALPGDKALLVGNQNAGSATDVALFDGATKTWSGRKTFTGAQLFAGNFLSGGTKFAAVASGNSAVYDLSSNTWSANVPAPSLPTGKVVALSSGTLVGVDSGGGGNAAVYDTAASAWVLTAAAPSALSPLFGFSLSGDRAIFFKYDGSVAIYTSLTTGTACTASADCASGHCIDGVCCESACKAQCMACNESGKAGQCVLVTGLPKGTRPACSGSLDCPGTCGGASSTCVPAAATKSCGTASCAGSSLTDPGKCSGVDGTCAYPAAKACAGNFRCADGASCKTTCASDLDCAAGFFCAGGTCGSTPADTGPFDTGTPDTFMPDTFVPDTFVPDTFVPDTAAEDTGSIDTSVEETLPPAPDAPSTPTEAAPAVPSGSTFKLCKANADCQSGHCVDGTCCDTACEERCFSCTLPTSPGTCSPVPLGGDPHGDCSGGGSCIGTCSGTGSCVTAFVGSQCAPSKCTGPSQGIGAAFCPGKGAKCPALAAAPFDCAPFACAPAFGACLTTCARSEHCAPGFVCEAGNKVCVPQTPPAADSSGCAFGARGQSGLALWSFAALAVGLRRRQLDKRRARDGWR